MEHRLWVLLGLTVAGCGGAQAERYDDLVARLREAEPPPSGEHGGEGGGAHLFEDEQALEREALVREVLRRNPSLEVARQAWRAAVARYDQETALPDPMLEYALAPLSLQADERFGQTVTLSQRFPFFGKLSAQGDVSLAEAEEAAESYDMAKLELALAASSLFDDYYANARALALVEEHRALLEDIVRAAEAQYAAGQVGQAQPLQAEVELQHIVHRRLVLESARAVLVARMNALLHRAPELPLPAPPDALDITPRDLSQPERLAQIALERRPEMRALAARLRARGARVDAAELAYWPDFGLMAQYNSMWPTTAHQLMVGVSVDLPIQLGRRGAAVDEAEASLAMERARAEALVTQIREEVEIARQRALEAQLVAEHYERHLMPAARQQIEAARIAYATGRGEFQGLVDAERTLRTLELDLEELRASYQQRLAELERALGNIPGLPDHGGER